MPGTGWVRNEIVGLETNGAGRERWNRNVPERLGHHLSSTAAGDRLVHLRHVHRGRGPDGKDARHWSVPQRIQSTDGSATYALTGTLDGGNYLNFQWAEYDLGTTTALVSMGDYSYGAVLAVPEAREEQPLTT